MSMLSKITTGRIEKPLFMCVYGDAGIGKTTFASTAPKTLFITTEEGTNEMDVARVQVNSWEEMTSLLSELIEKPTDYKTIAIDSLDQLEVLIHKKVAVDENKGSIEEIGWAKGYIFALNYWIQFIDSLKELRNAQNKNIILVSHAHLRSKNDPQYNETYDRYELKLHRKASELVKECVDMLLFIKKEIAFKKDGNKTKAFDMDRRLIYTEMQAAFDAKNRYGLPPEIEFQKQNAFGDLMKAINESRGESAESLTREIKNLIERVTDKEIREKAIASLESSENQTDKLKAIKNRLIAITKE